MIFNVKKIKTIFYLNIFFALIFYLNAPAASPKKILVIPIDIYAEEELKSLSKGVSSIFAKRLNFEDEVVIIKGKGIKITDIETKDAIALAKIKNADYVLFGSIALFADEFSFDISFIDLSGKNKTLNFNETGKNTNEVLSLVSVIAGEINLRVFKRKTEFLSSRAMQYLPRGARQQGSQAYINPNITEENGINFKESAPNWKSQMFKMKIERIDAGDINGDGKKEIVCCTKDTVYVFKYENKKLEKLMTVKVKGLKTIVGLSVADINKNGKAEIFVSSKTYHSNKMKSFVLELKVLQVNLTNNTNQ